MKLKNVLLLATVTFSQMLFNTSAHAFAPSIHIGNGFMKATKDCADLDLKKDDTLTIDATYTTFSVTKVSAGQFENLLSFSLPTEGSYVFEGPAGLQFTYQFLTNNFSGSDNFSFTADQTTGNVKIVHILPNMTSTTCTVVPVPFGSR